METPQYLLKLTQRLPVAGHQLSLATFFGPATYDTNLRSPSRYVPASSVLFSGDEMARGQHGWRGVGGGVGGTEETKLTIRGRCRDTCRFCF